MNIVNKALVGKPCLYITMNKSATLPLAALGSILLATLSSPTGDARFSVLGPATVIPIAPIGEVIKIPRTAIVRIWKIETFDQTIASQYWVLEYMDIWILVEQTNFRLSELLLNPSTPKFKIVHSPSLRKGKRISEVVRIGSIIIFHWSKLWKVKFFMLCDVIFLVRLQRKFEIDQSKEWKG